MTGSPGAPDAGRAHQRHVVHWSLPRPRVAGTLRRFRRWFCSVLPSPCLLPAYSCLIEPAEGVAVGVSRASAATLPNPGSSPSTTRARSLTYRRPVASTMVSGVRHGVDGGAVPSALPRAHPTPRHRPAHHAAHHGGRSLCQLRCPPPRATGGVQQSTTCRASCRASMSARSSPPGALKQRQRRPGDSRGRRKLHAALR